MITGIPTDDKKTVSEVFGRAEFFAIFVDGKSEPEFIDGTTSQEHGAGTAAVSLLVNRCVERICAPKLGPKAEEALRLAKIDIKTVSPGTELTKAAMA